MTSPLELHILGSFLIALLVALFQYRPWLKKARYGWFLSFCRAVSLALLILLILNPKVPSKTTTLVKPTLSILLDNSQSIQHLKKDKILDSLAEVLKQHPALLQKFDVQTYSFGDNLVLSDSLDFKAKQSNIGGSLYSLNTITTNEVAPVVLLSDGNQTVGRSYVFNSSKNTQPVYPLILGDSIEYLDLSIKQININSYTFLDNTFPVEIVLKFQGNSTVKTQLEIFSESKQIYTKPITFSPKTPIQVITPYLKANSPGIQRFTAKLKPLSEEILKTNNVKDFGLEVIDQKFNIALISEQSHPDLAAIKAIVTAQKNYALKRLTTNEFLEQSHKFDLLVLYQPNRSFQKVFEFLKQKPVNSFLITGPQTDWEFLNATQSIFKQENTIQTESYQAILNPNFEAFSSLPLPFEDLPPLESSFGQTTVLAPHDVLLYKSFEGAPTDIPLLITYKSDNARHVAFLAENIWKWRLRCFQSQQSFETFDAFFGNLFKYLSTQKASDKLKITHDVVFDGTSPMEITAQIFNDNFEPNTTTELSIEVRSKTQKSNLTFPMLLHNVSYKTDLSSLKPGRYDYTVQTNDKRFSKSGQFDILPFNIETQFLNANIPMLKQLAEETGGQEFFDHQAQSLIKALIQDARFATIQKIDKKTVPLIDLKIMLLLLLLSLSIEWFLRKYFGLI